jgi:hypothetical protein
MIYTYSSTVVEAYKKQIGSFFFKNPVGEEKKSRGGKLNI